MTRYHHRRQSPTPPRRSDCPWCAREWGERITGCTPCRRHARQISAKDELGALLIADLTTISEERKKAA